jgi:signal transduction histidine kinase
VPHLNPSFIEIEVGFSHPSDVNLQNEFAALCVGEHHMQMATSIITPESSEPHVAPSWAVVHSPCEEIVAALRKIEALEGMSDEDYLWLAENGIEHTAEPGTVVFREGDPPIGMNIVLAGEVHIRRAQSGNVAFFIARMGQLSGTLPYSRMKGYGGTGIAVGNVWSLDVPKEKFPAMLAAIPSMAQRCVGVLLNRVREVTRIEGQSDKLAALGKLAANLAHELNNPASAAQRSAASLFTELRDYGDRKYALGAICLSTKTAEKLQAWVERTRDEESSFERVDPVAESSPLAGADREAIILQWLETHKVPDAWTIAPAVAETRFPLTYLDDFAREFPDDVLAPAMQALASSLRVERMAETIISSTVRIFDLISAIKDYSYMDQAPIQDVDLAQSLERTLSMVGSRLTGIHVETDFDPELPAIEAYGSEVNQVWTALIENALDAMPNGGTLSLKTKLQGEMAVVEVRDTGVGIPPELESRIFEPFFTTKAPGKGLGLGLDTVQRIVTKHSGFVTVQSTPGDTCFQVRLPIDRAQAY